MIWLFIWSSTVDKRNAAECIGRGGQWVEYSHKMFMCVDNGRKQ
jgi:hypothetical protein